MRGGSRPYAQEANGSPARRHQKPQHPPQPQHSLHRVWRLLRLLRLFPERREPPGPVTFIFSVSVSSLFAAMDNFIDAAVEQFAHDHTEPETDLYRRLREETYRVMSSPQMQVGLIEGLFLKLLVRLIGARNILQIGMFTGYSTLMMAEALLADGRLITCEIDLKAEAIARRYFAESPHGHKITIRMGPALETIKTLSSPLDLVFIDADKVNYSNYYEACFPLVRRGG